MGSPPAACIRRGHAAKIPIVVVTGPTGAGKSALAMDLAEALGGEIVSADSMQVYRHLDIGTAKPTLEERARVFHHLVDYVDPADTYHVGRFLGDADRVILRLHQRGRVPVVCGGTALYLRALLHGLAPGPSRDPAVRSQLEARWEAGERTGLWAELGRVDPELVGRLHPNDRSRIVRGLEVWLVSGTPLSAWQRAHRFAEQRYHALVLGVEIEREELYRRIDARVLRMVAAGWVAEVERVLDAGYNSSIPALQAIGYRQICVWLERGGKWSAVVAEIQKQTRRFAKRQLTWFRRTSLQWFSPDRGGDVLARARKFLQTRFPTI